MKFLISGATGLVGKILIEHALKEGHEVHFLTRSKSKLGFHKGIKGFYLYPHSVLYFHLYIATEGTYFDRRI